MPQPRSCMSRTPCRSTTVTVTTPRSGSPLTSSLLPARMPSRYRHSSPDRAVPSGTRQGRSGCRQIDVHHHGRVIAEALSQRRIGRVLHPLDDELRRDPHRVETTRFSLPRHARVGDSQGPILTVRRRRNRIGTFAAQDPQRVVEVVDPGRRGPQSRSSPSIPANWGAPVYQCVRMRLSSVGSSAGVFRSAPTSDGLTRRDYLSAREWAWCTSWCWYRRTLGAW